MDGTARRASGPDTTTIALLAAGGEIAADAREDLGANGAAVAWIRHHKGAFESIWAPNPHFWDRTILAECPTFSWLQVMHFQKLLANSLPPDAGSDHGSGAWPCDTAIQAPPPDRAIQRSPPRPEDGRTLTASHAGDDRESCGPSEALPEFHYQSHVRPGGWKSKG